MNKITKSILTILAGFLSSHSLKAASKTANINSRILNVRKAILDEKKSNKEKSTIVDYFESNNYLNNKESDKNKDFSDSWRTWHNNPNWLTWDNWNTWNTWSNWNTWNTWSNWNTWHTWDNWHTWHNWNNY